jgi:predicted transcriptional regulator
MNVLLAGHESIERIELLLSLTRIDSKSQVKALKLHLNKGFTPELIASTYGVNKSNFSRVLSKLNATALIVERIKEIDKVVT